VKLGVGIGTLYKAVRPAFNKGVSVRACRSLIPECQDGQKESSTNHVILERPNSRVQSGVVLSVMAC